MTAAELYCNKNLYSCGNTVPLMSAYVRSFSLKISETRAIQLTVGATVIDIQKRKRLFSYGDTINSTWAMPEKLILASDSGGAFYVWCGGSSDTKTTEAFSEDFETVDTEILYLDIRNETVVTREIKNKIKFTSADSTAPSKTVSVFTGYDSTTFFSYLFDGISIEETISTYITIKGIKSLLHEETVGRGYPYLALLMPTFPVSANGIRFQDQWSIDTEFYRQDLRKGAELDGDAYLFRPEWCSVLGKLAQEMDERNAALKYDLDHQVTPVDISGTEGQPEVTVATLFDGGVAFDPNGNMFYSIAVNVDYYGTEPSFIFKNKLVVGGEAKEIPIEEEADVWFPIAPL